MKRKKENDSRESPRKERKGTRVDREKARVYRARNVIIIILI